MLRRLVLATRNKGKLQELTELLRGLPVEVIGLDQYPTAPEVAETGTTFAQNALIKARAIATHTGELTLADDSGLEVDLLGGEPGVYSARYGEPGWNDRERYEYLLRKLEGLSAVKRTARFKCVTALVDPHQHREEITEGKVEGQIALTPSGSGGFGYDPVFYLPEFRCTMAELSAEIKNRISHRGWALEKMIPYIEKALALS